MCDVVKAMFYTEGHPAGFTDDLGIIADKNQWVDAEIPGWYVFMVKNENTTPASIINWCKSNLSEYWFYNEHLMLYISDHDDAMLFKLRWVY